MKQLLSAKLFLIITAAFLTSPQTTLAASVSLPSYPLAVKSPYLSTWVPGNQLADASSAQPEFWQGQPLIWPVLARVGKTTFSLFGVPRGIKGSTHAKTTGISYTSTHTLVNLTADHICFTLDFFSPVQPGESDYALQSLPYSYLTVTATNEAGGSTHIQILNAIDQTWTAQDGAAQLNYTMSGNATFFWFHNPSERIFTENREMASYGTMVFGTTAGKGVGWACASADDLYSAFTHHGRLPRSTSCRGRDLAALSQDLGRLKAKDSRSATFVVGHDRVDAINLLGNTQTGVHRSRWSTIESAVGFVLSNYETALNASKKFDAVIRGKAEAVSSQFGSEYADLVEASVRQAFASFELTVPLNNLVAMPQALLKEISSDGNIQTIDLFFQSWPIFHALGPNYIRMFFQPILAYLQAGRWPHPWVIHDLGYSYPNATGHESGNAEQMPLFETSSMFILLHAYEKLTNDTAWLRQYDDLLEGYASWLSTNSLYPASQLTSVDAIVKTPNQTALAIQSAIGLKAAGILLNNATYTYVATSIAETIYEGGLGLNGETPSSSTHFTYNYGNSTTWNVLFAAYSDVALDLGTFPASAWDMQSKWYMAQMQDYGLAFAGPASNLDYDGAPLTWGLLDWNFVAAAASSIEVRSAIVNSSHAFLSSGRHTEPFGTKYQIIGPDAGKWIGNKARSTVGSIFALLALDQSVLDLT
ncbi:hypothetical protein LTR86_011129 [Recurvomyces mirabilis]|nr:hypothetical protein LTR86_011129 [Recurvomyces mirabilis]